MHIRIKFERKELESEFNSHVGSKRKRGCLVHPTRIAFGNIFRSPYESELSTAYAQMCTRFGTECQASSTPKSGQKEKETRRVSLFLFGGPDGS